MIQSNTSKKLKHVFKKYFWEIVKKGQNTFEKVKIC
jgi:hypothetical protein